MLTNLLLELLETGSLPSSRAKTLFANLKTLFDTGILVRRPKGAGEIVEVAKPEAFREWINVRYPALLGAFQSPSSRSSNIALNRDSKKGRRGLDHYTVLARAYDVPPGLSDDAQEAMKTLVDTTRTWGGACLFLETPREGGGVVGPKLPPGCRVMTIEGPDNHLHSERLRREADIFLLGGTGGRMGAAMIDWLAGQPSLFVRHFGDYDPVGLQETLRLLEKMPRRAEMFITPGIEDLFRLWANRRLMEADGNAKVFASIDRGIHPTVDQIATLIEIYGPLEQEACNIEALDYPS